MSMAEVIDALNEITNNDAVIVTDVGQHQMVACRYSKFKQSRSNVTSGGLGTMGFALPAAIGAKYGAPNRTVVAIIGDGGVQMTIQELGTIMRYSFVNITSPDYIMVAKGYGIEGQKVTNRENLKQALKTMVEHKGSYLLEVMVGKENNVFPMVPQGCSVAEIRLS
jgi:acetolactate synthase-1/2/3 large subunit